MKLENFANNYLELILGEYKGINLTRITEKNEFWQKQVIDSVYPFQEHSELNDLIINSNKIYDLGYGGGFPILPLAVIYAKKSFIGVESRLKKVKVVGDIASKIGISNVFFRHNRFEDVSFDKNSLILSKAMASVDKILPNINAPMGAKLALYKGPSFKKDELDNFYKKVKKWKIFLEKSYKLNDGSERLLIVFEKCST